MNTNSINLTDSQFRDADQLEKVQRTAMRMTRGPENMTHERKLNKLTKTKKLMRDIKPVSKHKIYWAVAQG